jgi:hypothetical protein
MGSSSFGHGTRRHFFDGPFVSLTQMSKSWELCPFYNVLDCSQTWIYNCLRVQEKGTQIIMSVAKDLHSHKT